MIVPVAHFQREPYSTFGNPFLIKIKEGESYEEIKERIRAHLDVPEKDFEKYRYDGLLFIYMCAILEKIYGFKIASAQLQHFIIKILGWLWFKIPERIT